MVRDRKASPTGVIPEIWNLNSPRCASIHPPQEFSKEIIVVVRGYIDESIGQYKTFALGCRPSFRRIFPCLETCIPELLSS